MRLLRDEKALSQEIEAGLEARLRERGATFGGRGLCPFAMPQFVARDDYDHVRTAARGIYGATLKAWKALGPVLHDLVGLTRAERDLVALDPGVASPSPLSRLDSFLTSTSYRFVELNAETPAGLGYAEVLSDVFLDLGVMRELQKDPETRDIPVVFVSSKSQKADQMWAKMQGGKGFVPKPADPEAVLNEIKKF